MKPVIVVWAVVLALVACLLFPPFGYNRVTHVVEINGQFLDPEDQSCVWAYAGHRFVFAGAPPAKTRVVKNALSSDYLMPVNTSVAWPLVWMECAIILLLGGGVFATIWLKRRSRS